VDATLRLRPPTADGRPLTWPTKPMEAQISGIEVAGRRCGPARETGIAYFTSFTFTELSASVTSTATQRVLLDLLRPKCPVQVEGRTDQSQMGERLGEIAERFTAGPRLLRVETEMIGIAEHLLKEQSSVVQA